MQFFFFADEVRLTVMIYVGGFDACLRSQEVLLWMGVGV